MNMRSSLVGSIVGLAAMLVPMSASAAEIKLMCPAPMRTTIVELVAQFEKATLHKVAIVHTPSRFIVERLRQVFLLADKHRLLVAVHAALARGLVRGAEEGPSGARPA